MACKTRYSCSIRLESNRSTKDLNLPFRLTSKRHGASRVLFFNISARRKDTLPFRKRPRYASHLSPCSFGSNIFSFPTRLLVPVTQFARLGLE
jgi:hypothetical protein